jgi:serine/threonine protein kinase/tetratricopeptide (TPR) repeat protein
MGEVYRATDTKLGREVALKVLPTDMAASPERLDRFQREAKALAALDHPGIVSVFSVEEAEGVHFLTMQLVEGESLDRVVGDDGLPLERLLQIGTALADALAAAHDKEIVHRDLKPANIMVGERGRVKILDFGLAKVATARDPEASDSQLPTEAHTREGMVLGTVPFMSPEQVSGQAVDHRTDIFSLGVILFEMATGKRPFEGRSAAELASAILRDSPAPVSELRAELPGDLGRVIRRCLEKDLRDRVQTASEVHNELRDLQRRVESGESLAVADSAPKAPAHESPDAGPSVAVLAFQNMSADPENEYFSDGLAEEILNALAQIEGLRVAARTSSFSFKGKALDIAEIGAKLKVANVLEGSVRRAGNRVRVTVQLVDVSNGFRLWSERYDRQMEDIFDVQDEIARAIADRLKLTLAGGATGRLVKAATRNMEAYDLYLKGRALLLKRGRAVAEAGACLQRAVELDPDMAAALAGLADTQTVKGFWGMAPPDQTRPQALAAARRAIELEPDSAEGHCALANATLLYERDYAVAESEFLRCLELNPGYTQGRCWYGLIYVQWVSGRLEDGVAEARRALEADPLSAYATAILGLTLGVAGQADESIEAARLAVERDPEALLTRWTLGNCCHWGERFEEAVAAFEAAAALSGRHIYTIGNLAMTYADWGRTSEARALHQEMEARQARDYVPRSLLALTAAAAGEQDRAVDLAREGYDAREPVLLLFARNFPDYRRLRDDPRFDEILRGLQLPGMDG